MAMPRLRMRRRQAHHRSLGRLRCDVAVVRSCAYGKELGRVNWDDEPFIKVYTRDTVWWCSLSWQAQGLLVLILRKCDRAGVIDLAGLGAAGLAGQLKMPTADLERYLPELTGKYGAIRVTDAKLVALNFVEAQGANKSERLRAKEHREKRRSDALRENDEKTENVTNRDATVTKSDAASQKVTKPSRLRKEKKREEKRDPPKPPLPGGLPPPGESLPLPGVDPPPLPEKTGKPKKPKPELSAYARDCIRRFREPAVKIHELQEKLRTEVFPATRIKAPWETRIAPIAEILAAGYSVEDCEHVLYVRAEEAKQQSRAGQKHYFNGTTHWGRKHFEWGLTLSDPRARGSPGVVDLGEKILERRRQEREAEKRCSSEPGTECTTPNQTG